MAQTEAESNLGEVLGEIFWLYDEVTIDLIREQLCLQPFIVLDADGVLWDTPLENFTPEINPSALEALQMLHGLGVPLVLWSGNSRRNIDHGFAALGFDLNNFVLIIAAENYVPYWRPEPIMANDLSLLAQAVLETRWLTARQKDVLLTEADQVLNGQVKVPLLIGPRSVQIDDALERYRALEEWGIAQSELSTCRLVGPQRYLSTISSDRFFSPHLMPQIVAHLETLSGQV
ncbi:hypothetical protein M1555_00085 [Patescibacteria group bacterium]|nr:hypothetical protein [Patescibacteria group bacterium]